MTNHNFSFRTDRYDFWPIYDAIKKYYPIGISESLEESFKGRKEKEKIIVENIHQPENYKSRWKDRISKWQQELELTVKSSTYGQLPSFSADVILEEEAYKDRIFTKKIHMAVSLLGPFYTLFGVDQTDLFTESSILEGRKGHFLNTHRMMVSPELEFKETFVKLRDLVEDEFDGYRFVPYGMFSSTIEGLHLNFLHSGELPRVYYALFDNMIDFNCRVEGDQFKYGSDQWYIENPNMEDYWTIYPPGYQP
ncbi:hypothetical protein [Marinoscillum pacificum]|uniref:hypothetical protein n=1 Tax=Marinoscillum pacificum TaxID=392723 RepID=UPI0021580981|nr:hypothetical protein [Marinoscillum pacificum]